MNLDEVFRVSIALADECAKEMDIALMSLEVNKAMYAVWRCSWAGCEFAQVYEMKPDLRDYIAMVDEHYERAHTVRDESAEYLPLTPNDRRFLEGMRISTD